MKRPFAAIMLAASLFALAPAAHAESSPELDAAIESYILKHPDVLMKSLKSYRGKEKITAEQAEKISKLEGAPVLGNKKGDVTIVEFFDYHCGYCKRFFPVVSEVLEKDKNLKVVFLELPILSEDSELAAKAALAVHDIAPDKYFGYHTALMKMNGKFEEEKLAGLAKQAGVDEGQFKEVMKSEKISKEIANIKALAEEMEVQATPTIILNQTIIPGAIDADKLRAKIAMARENKTGK